MLFYSHTSLTNASGAPGAGKGTLCSHLAQKYNFTHYSLGDGLRSWMCEHRSEPLALEIQDKLDNQGFLAPEDLNPFITQEIKDAIYQNSQGILIDGFPRSKEQLQAFDHWPLQDKLPFASDGEFCAKPNVALSFKASKENARARYLRRARDSNDSKEKFERRFAEYEDETLAVEHVYRQRGILMEVSKQKTLRN